MFIPALPLVLRIHCLQRVRERPGNHRCGTMLLQAQRTRERRQSSIINRVLKGFLVIVPQQALFEVVTENFQRLSGSCSRLSKRRFVRLGNVENLITCC